MIYTETLFLELKWYLGSMISFRFQFYKNRTNTFIGFLLLRQNAKGSHFYQYFSQTFDRRETGESILTQKINIKTDHLEMLAKTWGISDKFGK